MQYVPNPESPVKDALLVAKLQWQNCWGCNCYLPFRIQGSLVCFIFLLYSQVRDYDHCLPYSQYSLLHLFHILLILKHYVLQGVNTNWASGHEACCPSVQYGSQISCNKEWKACTFTTKPFHRFVINLYNLKCLKSLIFSIYFVEFTKCVFKCTCW